MYWKISQIIVWNTEKKQEAITIAKIIFDNGPNTSAKIQEQLKMADFRAIIKKYFLICEIKLQVNTFLIFNFIRYIADLHLQFNGLLLHLF